MSTTVDVSDVAAAIEDAVEAVRRTLPDDGLVLLFQSGTWLEAAAATHGGECEDCGGQTRHTTPAWDWVDDDVIRGTWDAQCGRCGQQGSGWVQTGARDFYDEIAAEIDGVEGWSGEVERAVRERVAEVEALRDKVQADMAEDVRADLRRRLTVWVEAASAAAAAWAAAVDDDERDEARSELAGAWLDAGLARNDEAFEPSMLRSDLTVGTVTGWAPTWDSDEGIWETVADDRITQALLDVIDETDA